MKILLSFSYRNFRNSRTPVPVACLGGSPISCFVYLAKVPLTHFSETRIYLVGDNPPVVAAAMVATELRNIFVLGTSFLLIFTGFHTLALLQTLDNGVRSPKNSLAVVYVVFGLTCSSAPCLLSLLGHRCLIVCFLSFKRLPANIS